MVVDTVAATAVAVAAAVEEDTAAAGTTPMGTADMAIRTLIPMGMPKWFMLHWQLRFYPAFLLQNILSI